MVDILLLLIFNSLVCLGVYIGTQWDGSDQFDDYPENLRGFEIKDPMILWWIRYYASYLPKFWQKPIYRCLPCMASVWSVPVLVTAVLTGYIGVFEAIVVTPTYVLSLAGLNYWVSTRLA